MNNQLQKIIDDLEGMNVADEHELLKVRLVKAQIQAMAATQETKTVTNVTLNSKYRVSYKQESTKGVLGFTVEANGDDRETVASEASWLKNEALEKTTWQTMNPAPEVKA